MAVAIRLKLSMTVFVPRSREIPRSVRPKTMVSLSKRVEMFCEPLFGAFLCGNSLFSAAWWHAIALFSGGSAFVLVDFDLLKWHLRFFIHVSTLLNLLPNCLCNLRSCCLKWFFCLHNRVLTLASQRLCCGASPSPKLACPSNLTFLLSAFLSKEKFGPCCKV